MSKSTELLVISHFRNPRIHPYNCVMFILQKDENMKIYENKPENKAFKKKLKSCFPEQNISGSTGPQSTFG